MTRPLSALEGVQHGGGDRLPSLRQLQGCGDPEAAARARGGGEVADVLGSVRVAHGSGTLTRQTAAMVSLLHRLADTCHFLVLASLSDFPCGAMLKGGTNPRVLG